MSSGSETAEVDHFHLDAFLRQPVRGLERGEHHRAISEERDVGPIPSGRGHANRDDLVAFWHRALGASIQILVLEVDDGIVVANGGFQQALGVERRGGRDHFQPRAVHEPGFGVLRMIETAADVTAARRADNHRHRRAAAVAIPEGRRLVDDLIEAAGDEVGKLHLGDRPVATERRADADAHDGRFGDRRVDHAHLAELVMEALRDAKSAAVGADIFAQDEDLRIAPHLLEQRFADRLEVREFFAHSDLATKAESLKGIISHEDTKSRKETKCRQPDSIKSGNHDERAIPYRFSCFRDFVAFLGFRVFAAVVRYAYRSVTASSGFGSGAFMANSTASSITAVIRPSMSLTFSSVSVRSPSGTS